MSNFNISFNFDAETKTVSDIVVMEIDKIKNEDDFSLDLFGKDDSEQFNFDFNNI